MPTSPVEIVLTFSTGLVASAFALSGVSKLGRSSATLTSMSMLRVPEVLRSRAVAAAVPCAELLIALALIVLPGFGRQLAGALAAAMLALFTALLIRVLHRGDAVDCGCFGALSFETRVTNWSVARNVVLLAASLTTAWLARGADAFLVDLFSQDVVVLLASALGWSMALIVVLARGLMVTRRHRSSPNERAVQRVPQKDPAPLSPTSLALGIDPSRPGEVAMGDQIPHAELVSDRGQTRSIAELGNGRPTVLIFLSVECDSCRIVAQRVPGWKESLQGVDVLVATSSEPHALASAYPQLSPLARYGSHAALVALGVQRSPAAVLLGGQHQPVIASPIAYGIVEIEALVQGVASATRV